MKTWGLGYEKSKRKAKTIYAQIGRVPSPALGDALVAFTSAGFNHLIRKGRIPRPKNEQKRRFALIPHIEKIIKNPKATIQYERRETRDVVNRHGNKITIQSIADFWTFSKEINGCEMKVVIREIVGKVGKHFLSVMGDKVKIKKKPKRKH